MVDFKRKKGESFESFLRRFNKALISSRKLNEVRKRQYQKRKRIKTSKKSMLWLASKCAKRKNI